MANPSIVYSSICPWRGTFPWRFWWEKTSFLHVEWLSLNWHITQDFECLQWHFCLLRFPSICASRDFLQNGHSPTTLVPPPRNIATLPIRYILVEIFETRLSFYTNHYLRKIIAATSIENFNWGSIILASLIKCRVLLIHSRTLTTLYHCRKTWQQLRAERKSLESGQWCWE